MTIGFDAIRWIDVLGTLIVALIVAAVPAYQTWKTRQENSSQHGENKNELLKVQEFVTGLRTDMVEVKEEVLDMRDAVQAMDSQLSEHLQQDRNMEMD